MFPLLNQLLERMIAQTIRGVLAPTVPVVSSLFIVLFPRLIILGYQRKRLTEESPGDTFYHACLLVVAIEYDVDEFVEDDHFRIVRYA